MKYLLVVNNSNKLIWHVCARKSEVISTLIARHSNLLKECNYNSGLLSAYILLFEIEPNYEQLEISVSPPAEPTIRIS